MPSRDPSESPQRILDAAREEFDRQGFVGARMESIAKRAGLNKGLVYRHFRTKENLYREVLRALFAQRIETFRRSPDSLGDVLVHWVKAAKKRPHFQRLLMREALNPDVPVVHEQQRRDYYRDQLEDLERRQREGQLDPELDLSMVLLAMVAVVTFADSYPRLTRLITGLDPGGRAFQTRWRRFLHQLAERLGPESPG